MVGQFCRYWNTCVKLAYDIPRSTHTYLVEHCLAAEFTLLRLELLSMLSVKIEKESGHSIRNLTPKCVRELVKIQDVPINQDWRFSLLKTLLTLWRPMTYIYVISAQPLRAQWRTFTSEARRAFFISKMRAKNGVVWKVLCDQKILLEKIIRMTPKTRRKTEFYHLLSYWQSFVKSIGVFPAGRGTFLKIWPVLR